MRYVLFIAVAACALGACKDKSSTTTVTTNAQTGAVTTTGDSGSPASLGLQPGKWEMKIAVSDLKMANMPKGMNATPPPATTSACLTPEQAAKGPAEVLKGANMDCTMTRSTFSGGKVESEMTCKMPGGGTMRTKTSGTYSATALDTMSETEVTGANQMSQKVHTEGRRVGECDAGGAPK